MRNEAMLKITGEENAEKILAYAKAVERIFDSAAKNHTEAHVVIVALEGLAQVGASPVNVSNCTFQSV